MFDFNPLAALFLFRALSARESHPDHPRAKRGLPKPALRLRLAKLLAKFERPRRSETPAERINWSLGCPRIAEKRN